MGKFSLQRLRRRVGLRPICIAFATGAGALAGALIFAHDLFEAAQWIQHELGGMNQHLALALNFVLRMLFSPAFYAAISLSTTIYLVVKVGTQPIDSRGESFVEAAESWIRAAESLLRQSQLTMFEMQTWQEKTALDLGALVGHRSVFGNFRREGRLLGAEYEAGETGLRSALKREIRFLREMIDRADRGEIDFDLSLHELTSR